MTKFVSAFVLNRLDGLQALLEENFDSKAFATRAIQNQVVGETLKKLSEGILGLNEEIRSQVCNSNIFCIYNNYCILDLYKS